MCKPRSEGGTLEKKGVTEVVSSLDRDGKDVPHHLAMGTYVVIESDSAYAGQCFVEYNCLPDKSGTLRRAVSADAHDRAGARHLRGLGGAAQGADRRAHLLQLRRGRHRQARAEEGRDAGRRGRLPGVGQADAGRRVAGRRAICRWASPATSSSSATSPKASRCAGRTWPSTPATTPSRSAARWKPCSRGRTGSEPTGVAVSPRACPEDPAFGKRRSLRMTGRSGQARP